MLEKYGIDDPDKADDVVGDVIASFGNVDPASFSHRYPCDRNGNLIQLPTDRIDLEQLQDVMDGVFGYFSGTDGYLDNLTRN